MGCIFINRRPKIIDNSKFHESIYLITGGGEGVHVISNNAVVIRIFGKKVKASSIITKVPKTSISKEKRTNSLALPKNCVLLPR